ncbi:MAG: outer membrane lipid asymmetry maintenance protein MlaD [Alphaproteobacteria bacterium]
MNRNIIEVLVGFLVIAIAVSFLAYTYKVANVKKLGGSYQVIAKFDQVDGIIVGSDVMISGIKVGSVSELTLDTKSYDAFMVIEIGDDIKLPADSSARIVSSGLLGGKYVELQAGADDQLLKNNETIQYTQSSVNLESLLGKFIFSSASTNNKAPENLPTPNNGNDNKTISSTPTPTN